MTLRNWMFLAVCMQGLSATFAGSFNLTLAATARFNGKLYPNNKYGTMAEGWMVNENGSTSSSSWSTVYGGPAKAAGVTNVLRATRDNVVAVDMGGFYYKQQFYTYDGIKSAATVYNMMEIDVATIDEWDLFGCDGTCEVYADWVNTIEGTSFLAANLNWDALAQNPYLNRTRIAPWEVKVLSGREVGFVGFINSDITETVNEVRLPSSVRPTYSALWSDKTNADDWLGDPMAFAIQELEVAHPSCNIIVFVGVELVGAGGGDVWARNMFLSYPELDVIVSSENDIVGSEIISRNGIGGAYMGVPLAMVSGKYSSGAMAVSSFMFDDDGFLQEVEQEMLSLDDDYDADLEIWGFIASIYDNATGALQEVVSTASVEVNGEEGELGVAAGDDTTTTHQGCRVSDCPMGRLVNMANIVQCPDCDFAWMNGGGIRSSFDLGDISLNNLKAATPFDNYLTSVEMTGAGVMKLLEFVMSISPRWDLCDKVMPEQCSSECDESKCDGDGGYAQFFGLRWSYNLVTQDIMSVDIFDRETKLWYSLEADRTYKFVTIDYLVNGGDGYGVISEEGFSITQLPGAQYDAFEELVRSTTEVFQGLPSVLSDEPSLSLFEQSHGSYADCDILEPLGMSTATLPMRSTMCTIISVGSTPGEYQEPPYDSSIAVIVGSADQAVAAAAAITAINADSSILPYTELCVVMLTSADMSDLNAVMAAELAALNCSSGRTAKVPVAASVAPWHGATSSNEVGIPTVLYDALATIYQSSADYPYLITASPSYLEYCSALVAILDKQSWFNFLILFTADYTDIADSLVETLPARFEPMKTMIDTGDAAGSSALDAMGAKSASGIPVVLVFANDADTASALAAADTDGKSSGYAYIVLSEAGALSMEGALVLKDPHSSAEYVTDAIYAAANGINDLLADWMSASLTDFADAKSALGDAVLVHSYISSATFTGPSTGAVEFSPAGSRATTGLIFASVQDSTLIPALAWSSTAASEITYTMTSIVWPGGETTAPILCEVGFIAVDGVCVADVNTHELPGWIQAVMIFAATASIFLSLACSLWTNKYSKRLIVRLSVPPYLFMVCAGTTLSSLSSVMPAFGLGTAGCQLMVYLYGFGFVLVTSALCTKMYSMEKVLDNSIKMKSSQYDYATAAKMMATFAFGELVILAAWSFSESPLHYDRQCIAFANGGMYDGECLESVGKCRSNQASVFVTLLTLYHVACLFVGMRMCYHVRNLPSILSEGKWVFTAFYSQLQAVVIAVPVLIMIKDEYEFFTFLKSLVICASDLTTLIMLFVPKMQMIKQYHDFDKNKVAAYIRDTMASSTQEDSVYEKLRKERHVNSETGDSFYSSNATVASSASEEETAPQRRLSEAGAQYKVTPTDNSA